MEAISREFRDALPWLLLYAEDLEGKGTKVNTNKTKVMISGENGYGILPDHHAVFVVEVLVETQCSVLRVRSGFTGSVVL